MDHIRPSVPHACQRLGAQQQQIFQPRGQTKTGRGIDHIYPPLRIADDSVRPVDVIGIIAKPTTNSVHHTPAGLPKDIGPIAQGHIAHHHAADPHDVRTTAQLDVSVHAARGSDVGHAVFNRHAPFDPARVAQRQIANHIDGTLCGRSVEDVARIGQGRAPPLTSHLDRGPSACGADRACVADGRGRALVQRQRDCVACGETQAPQNTVIADVQG